MSLARQRLHLSNVLAYNDLDQHPRMVIGPNPSRTGITFHNPGLSTIVVFPELVRVYGRHPRGHHHEPDHVPMLSLPSRDLGGLNLQGHNHPLHPTVEFLGGGFVLNAAGTLFFTDPSSQQAWQALALSGNCQPLTIMEQG